MIVPAGRTMMMSAAPRERSELGGGRQSIGKFRSTDTDHDAAEQAARRTTGERPACPQRHLLGLAFGRANAPILHDRRHGENRREWTRLDGGQIHSALMPVALMFGRRTRIEV
jgi:hypothetical protein